MRLDEVQKVRPFWLSRLSQIAALAAVQDQAHLNKLSNKSGDLYNESSGLHWTIN